MKVPLTFPNEPVHNNLKDNTFDENLCKDFEYLREILGMVYQDIYAHC